MAKILISPSKYLQGAGEMKNIGTYAAKCGKKALVLISQGGYRRIGAMIEESFAGSDCDVVFDYFNGECCESEINRLVAIVKEKGCDLVIGVGGGKIFDTAKAVAYRKTSIHLPDHRIDRCTVQRTVCCIHRRGCIREIPLPSGKPEPGSDGH